jgi:hypothetical protein
VLSYEHGNNFTDQTVFDNILLISGDAQPNSHSDHVHQDAVGTMSFLVTNDDGITAPGLLALAHAMRPFGDIKI